MTERKVKRQSTNEEFVTIDAGEAISVTFWRISIFETVQTVILIFYTNTLYSYHSKNRIYKVIIFGFLIADEIPRIVCAGGGKSETKNSSAAINKLSHNVSKAADTAKERFSLLFNRRSNPPDMCTSCESCRMVCAACTDLLQSLLSCNGDCR